MTYFIKFLSVCSITLFISCVDKQDAKLLEDNPDTKTLFTRAPGEELFKTNCITCHSLRYIQMQPPFPRKTWEKIVDKMIKNFGAPIPDSTAKTIADYLVAVKGKK
jgi:hypothetical protein